MAAQVLPIEAIVSDPDVRGGQPVVAGTGIRVSDLASYHIAEGLSADQLAAQFKLDLAQVHAALAYYYRAKKEIDAEIRANAEEAEALKQQLQNQGRIVSL